MKALLPHWSEFSFLVRIRTFCPKQVRKQSEFCPKVRIRSKSIERTLNMNIQFICVHSECSFFVPYQSLGGWWWGGEMIDCLGSVLAAVTVNILLPLVVNCFNLSPVCYCAKYSEISLR